MVNNKDTSYNKFSIKDYDSNMYVCVCIFYWQKYKHII